MNIVVIIKAIEYPSFYIIIMRGWGWGCGWERVWLALPIACVLGSCASGDGAAPSVEVVADTVEGVERLTYSAAAGPHASRLPTRTKP